MERRPVNTKQDFVKRYAAGEFGNASPTWDSLEAMEEDYENSFPMLNDETQLWHIRNRVASGLTWYDVPGDRLADTWTMACNLVDHSNLYISAMAPTHLTLLQGEVYRSPQGLALYYSTLKLPMRKALEKRSEQVYGLDSLLLLKKELNYKSYEWLEYLLEAYPDHVVEFSAYDKNWGTLRGYNTVFWEVRNY